MINQIREALNKALQNQPGDFLLSTKQEDYLTYRISSELTNCNINSLFPTQWKRFDIVEISHVNNKILKTIEAKYHYSSDFTNITDYGQKCFISDYNKLIGEEILSNCDKYLLQFVVHFNESHIKTWRDHLNGNIFGFNRNSNYFTYIHNGALNRINPNLYFRNTKDNIYKGDFNELYIKEIGTFRPRLHFEGSCFIDLSKATVLLTGAEFPIPHEFHCFLWKIN